MPYIKQVERDNLDSLVHEMGKTVIGTEGNLNYLITRLCQRYVDENKPFGYKTVNAVVGVLECAKLEFYRRVASAYEDKKIAENGDVY